MQGFQTHTAIQPISIQPLQTQQKPRVTEVRHNAEKHSLLIFICCVDDTSLRRLTESILVSVFADLGRMYQLVSRIQDGLGELKSLLESHIYNQGLAAIEKCGESALNVSIKISI